MSTVMDVFDQLCTADLIPDTRRKNFRASLKILAAAYDSPLEALTLTPDLASTYETRLKEYCQSHLTDRGKPYGYYTIRNTVQEVKQVLKLAQTLTPAAALVPVMTNGGARMGTKAAKQALRDTSTNPHQQWVLHSWYRVGRERWPQDIRQQFDAYCDQVRGSIRAKTLENRLLRMDGYISYLLMTPDQRLALIHPDTRGKLELKTYAPDLRAIVSTPSAPTWDDLFDLRRLKSCITWLAWRHHAPKDAEDREREPSTPTALGYDLAHILTYVAKTMARPEHADLVKYIGDLSRPMPVFHKTADYHKFEFAELEDVALKLIQEARAMTPTHAVVRDRGEGKEPQVCRPGTLIACRFQVGLVLMLAWRNPMRARNWCEAKWYPHDLNKGNLRRIQGRWHFHWEGKELKIGQHGRLLNVHDFEVRSEVVPYLEEWLHTWRLLLPGAATNPHVFLGRWGRPLTTNSVREQLANHVYRFTGKRLFTHLLRTIFATNHFDAGAPLNAVAQGLGDTVPSVIGFYNQLYPGRNVAIINDLIDQALARQPNGHGSSRG